MSRGQTFCAPDWQVFTTTSNFLKLETSIRRSTQWWQMSFIANTINSQKQNILGIFSGKYSRGKYVQVKSFLHLPIRFAATRADPTLCYSTKRESKAVKTDSITFFCPKKNCLLLGTPSFIVFDSWDRTLSLCQSKTAMLFKFLMKNGFQTDLTKVSRKMFMDYFCVPDRFGVIISLTTTMVGGLWFCFHSDDPDMSTMAPTLHAISTHVGLPQ